ncbi:Ctr copper transporter family-domain-containing protein [Myxozyma melibiosi]|uniref:Copper transport protein n=1 Tax=Myxozyma melibiosi TaxID=54550 RepID=A0ABR1F5T1_9ASCO
MDHSHHHHHHASPDDAACKMAMIFNWDPIDTCIVFEWWHIRGLYSLTASLLAVVALGVSYEYLRTWPEAAVLSAPAVLRGEKKVDDGEGSGYGPLMMFVNRNRKEVKAVLYGVQVVYSYFIMLVAMTYNGWILLAVGVGAYLGHRIFNKEEDESGPKTQKKRGMSCH